MTAPFDEVRGTWQQLTLPPDDPGVTLTVRVWCWCGWNVHLELPRWPEDDCGNCHSVYRLSLTADGTPQVRCVQLDTTYRSALVEFLEHTGRATPDAAEQ